MVYISGVFQSAIREGVVMSRAYPQAIIAMVCLCLISIGCSAGSIPVEPPHEPFPEPPPLTGEHTLFGYVALTFDHDNERYTINRTPDTHYNFTNPDFDGLDTWLPIITTNEISGPHVFIEVEIGNNTVNDYYDVRGILLTNAPYVSLVNPDGYSNLFDDGGDIEWNPFMAFSQENEDRIFASGEDTELEWDIRFTPGESMDCVLLIEGSYPGHCEDVASISYIGGTEILLTPGGPVAHLEAFPEDWQSDVEAVDLHIPALAVEIPGDVIGNGEKYHFNFANTTGLTPGQYGFYMEAWSPNREMATTRNYGVMEIRESDIVIDPSEFTGHPCRGINQLRNNRSPYTGPSNLQSISENTFTSIQYDYTPGVSFTPRALRISGDNRYFYGEHRSFYEWSQWGSTSSSGSTVYALASDGTLINSGNGGEEIIVMTEQVLCSYDSSGSSSSHPPGGEPGTYSSGSSHYIYAYSPDLEKLNKYGGGTWYYLGYYSDYGNDGVGVEVHDFFPLFDNYFLSLEEGNENYGPWTGRAVIRDAVTLQPAPWAGIHTYDEDTIPFGGAASPDGRIYYVLNGETSTLICTDIQLTTIWTAPIAEAIIIPAISDDGTIFVGTVDGVSAFTRDGEHSWFYEGEIIGDFAIDHDDNLLVPILNYELLCLSGLDGTLVWASNINLNGIPADMIVDAIGNIYITTDEAITILDSNGVVLDTYNFGQFMSCSNAVICPDGKLAVVRNEKTFSQDPWGTRFDRIFVCFE